MPLGLAGLLAVDATVLQVLIAIAVLGGMLALARGLTLNAGTAVAAVAGAAGGFLRTSTSAAGPPVIIYLQGRHLPADVFRATGAFYLTATGAVAVALFAASGRLDAGTGLAVLTALPALATALATAVAG